MVDLDRWWSQQINYFPSACLMLSWPSSVILFLQVFLSVTIRRDTSVLLCLQITLFNSTGNTGRQENVLFSLSSVLEWFISVLGSLLEVLAKTRWSRPLLQTGSCNFTLLCRFQQATTSVGMQPYGLMGSEQVLMLFWLIRMGVGIPQGTEKKNKPLFYLWIADLSSPEQKIWPFFFQWNTLLDMSLWV